jgi:hypothetical protein
MRNITAEKLGPLYGYYSVEKDGKHVMGYYKATEALACAERIASPGAVVKIFDKSNTEVLAL